MVRTAVVFFGTQPMGGLSRLIRRCPTCRTNLTGASLTRAEIMEAFGPQENFFATTEGVLWPTHLGVVRCSIFGRTCWEMHPEVSGLTSGPRFAGNHFSAQNQAPTRWHRRDLRLRPRNREKSSRSLPLFGRADVFWLGEKDCRL